MTLAKQCEEGERQPPLFQASYDLNDFAVTIQTILP
eukprot:CAMPEP_0119338944 /NCGR_PEP_ID=MMETSP1333-20130426/97241_1 /TAXON_ID=418940 /ORGANISM="Scyphosphaera apsteinii, Strain RCC1455" /LENGTH=35 /DNA_ID= /DNA_START= /DNA_END= /DNA_ORIENTATION=